VLHILLVSCNGVKILRSIIPYCVANQTRSLRGKKLGSELRVSHSRAQAQYLLFFDQIYLLLLGLNMHFIPVIRVV